MSSAESESERRFASALHDNDDRVRCARTTHCRNGRPGARRLRNPMFSGAGHRVRTDDLKLGKLVLYQLS